jgi:hypothetical protein
LNLHVRPILRDTWRAYKAHWKVLVPLAALILAPQAIVDGFVGDIEIEKIEKLSDVLKLASVPTVAGINLGGEALFSGIVAALITQWRRGEAAEDLRVTAREIPYLRLIAADLLLILGVAVGLVLLVIPGLVFYAYFLIAPALIEINGLTVRQAFHQAYSLVQGNFWRVLGIAVVVLVFTDAVTGAVEAPIEGVEGVGGEIIFNLAAHAVIEPFSGLVTVLLAFTLSDMAATTGERRELAG